MVTSWDVATRRLALRVRGWIGQTVTVSGPGRTARMTEPSRHQITGTIGHVTAAGFTVEWWVADGWRNPHQVVQRAFVAWTDLWAAEGRVSVTGLVVEGTQTVDVGRVVSAWIAETAHGLGTVSEKPDPRLAQKGVG